VRCLFATNEVSKMRSDFVGRLEIRMYVPPLVLRPEDISLIARDFVLELWATETELVERFIWERKDKEPEPRFEGAFIAAITRHVWTTNVRELRQLVREAIGTTPKDCDTILNNLASATTPAVPAKKQKRASPRVECTDEEIYTVWMENDENATAAGEKLGIDRFSVARAVARHRKATSETHE
jgi:DNA-binding NtrC family response regulator